MLRTIWEQITPRMSGEEVMLRTIWEQITPRDVRENRYVRTTGAQITLRMTGARLPSCRTGCVFPLS